MKQFFPFGPQKTSLLVELVVTLASSFNRCAASAKHFARLCFFRTKGMEDTHTDRPSQTDRTRRQEDRRVDFGRSMARHLSACEVHTLDCGAKCKSSLMCYTNRRYAQALTLLSPDRNSLVPWLDTTTSLFHSFEHSRSVLGRCGSLETREPVRGRSSRLRQLSTPAHAPSGVICDHIFSVPQTEDEDSLKAVRTVSFFTHLPGPKILQATLRLIIGENKHFLPIMQGHVNVGNSRSVATPAVPLPGSGGGLFATYYANSRTIS